MADSVHLPGGSGGVWFVVDPVSGPVVHRPAGPWTPAVHELLAFLAEAGLDGVPRVVGFDDEGREVLSHLPGRTIAVDDECAPDQVLADAAAWLRRYHDVVRDFDPGPRAWRQLAGAAAPGQLICHNDTGAYNWIVEDDRFIGMIDWDQAGPGHPIDDLAFLCWSGVPLFREVPVADVTRRVSLAARSYGGIDAARLLDAVADRMTRASSRIEAGIRRGDPGMLALRAHGEPQRTRDRVTAFAARLPGIRSAL
jgi:aminoglycoside phosphotransferase (APT) family kinase protein